MKFVCTGPRRTVSAELYRALEEWRRALFSLSVAIAPFGRMQTEAIARRRAKLSGHERAAYVRVAALLGDDGALERVKAPRMVRRAG